MNKTSPNFRDGRIEQVTATADYVDMRILCAAVEGGELTVSICPHPDGWIYIHFSGLGDKIINTSRTSANDVDIRVQV